jgi:transposase-like protein
VVALLTLSQDADYDISGSIEQDSRRLKQRLRPMLGLKSFRTATVVMSGFELAETIKKRQYKIGKLSGRAATMPAISGGH